jgi:hypothetical protein
MHPVTLAEVCAQPVRGAAEGTSRRSGEHLSGAAVMMMMT